MRKLAEAFYFMTITLWVGGMWAIGYIVAPVLFNSLGDRQLAGVVAGKLFALIGWIGLGSAAYLMLFLIVRLHTCYEPPNVYEITGWRCRSGAA